ncbi:putative UDP-glucuronosyltransferase 1-8-like 2 [Homarus americanus]|uniref:Putative UDP-glucuronosyltransferase 1-8-like 2 n=1 Tax=Homarus americanus TaxID=6706 RepID=A0A8J5N284_HOMAM|nr:putative UDP-glucuronosyltransferase 1-8-like 2 [Homarus americanus]
MRPILLLVVVVMLLGGAVSELPPPERSYNILMVLMVASPSHRNVFVSLAEGLADRGHKVHMLSCLSNFSTARNITQHYVGLNIMDDLPFNVQNS